ncbi:NTP transferase domain-containing protein [Micromonospora sp. NPDC047548]|uniref:molybdenum cofactor guanylyltransferase n=1 Tax=Micromonospora sp. NPDC047548 TaxID=3155624 RepID=UPI003406B0A9
MVLAGGAARRMGGTDKPAVRVGGRRMRDRVLDAVSGASPRIVVGPAAGLPAGVLAVREDPPGGGPAAAAAAGLLLLGPGTTTVALLAADLPLLTAEAVHTLRRQLTASDVDGACYLDENGQRQVLCGVWRVESLRGAVSALAAGRHGSLDGASMRALLAGLRVAELRWTGSGPAPWFDCDTDDDVRRAEELAR